MEPKQQVERLIAIAHPPLLGGASSHALQVVKGNEVATMSQQLLGGGSLPS